MLNPTAVRGYAGLTETKARLLYVGGGIRTSSNKERLGHFVCRPGQVRTRLHECQRCTDQQMAVLGIVVIILGVKPRK